jgi:endonuclease/exonuclease/phosphatase family metal-dependent hydrolase
MVLSLVLVIFYFWAISGSIPTAKLSEIKIFQDLSRELLTDKQTFTVMTYNIGYLSGMYNNLPIKTTRELFEKNMQAFLKLLEHVKPDFIGFQEIDFASKRSCQVDQVQMIAESAGYKYNALAVNWDKQYVPFPTWPPSVNFGKIISGQAVCSRLPIISTQRIVLEKPGNKPFYYQNLYLDRLVQVTNIKIFERNLILLNVHLEAFDRHTREKQARKTLEIYRTFKDNYPVLLLGDFNCVPPDAPQKNNFIDEPGTDFTNDGTIALFLAEKSLSMADPARFTFPSEKPTRRLDYIFYNHEKIHCVKSWVMDGIDCSDHLPLLMTFSFIAGSNIPKDNM